VITNAEKEAHLIDPAHGKQTPLIYIAAAYTQPDPVVNTQRALHIADALLEAGIIPLIPHLNIIWHLVSPKPYYRWLEYDGHLLVRCDAVLRVPGYSAGAALECAFAENRGMAVIHPLSDSPTDCVSAVTDWLSHSRKDLY